MPKILISVLVCFVVSTALASVSRRGFLTGVGVAVGTTVVPCNVLLGAVPLPVTGVTPISETTWMQLIRFIPYRATSEVFSPFQVQKFRQNCPLAMKVSNLVGTPEQKAKLIEDYLIKRRESVDQLLPRVPYELAIESGGDVEEIKADIKFFWSVSANYGNLRTYARLDGKVPLLLRYIEEVRKIEPNIVAPLIDITEWLAAIEKDRLPWADRHVYNMYEQIGFENAGPKAKAAIERFRQILSLPTREERELAESYPDANWSVAERESRLQILRDRYAFEAELEAKAKMGHHHGVSATSKAPPVSVFNAPLKNPLTNMVREGMITEAPEAQRSEVSSSPPLQLTYQPESVGVPLPNEREELKDKETIQILK